jgi:ABC-type branched-subunit amino acid transport system ATPase component
MNILAAVPGVPLLQAKGLRRSFGGRVVLDGINLELCRGEVVLLRGENGSGKTTLLNILTGNLEPNAGEIRYSTKTTPRAYHFPRRWWQELNPWSHFGPEFVAKEGMGRTWQDIRLFRSLLLRDNIAVARPGQPGESPVFALLNPSRTRKVEARIQAEADALLARLGLAGRESSSADKVSLGQSKRVGIARAVAAGARVLFLDEPIAGLDHRGIADILTLLESLVSDRHLTLVIVEHVSNQPHLHGLVTTDWLLENGKLKSNGTFVSSSTPPSEIRKPRLAAHPAWGPLVGGDDSGIINELLPRGALLTRIRRPDRFRPYATPVLEIRNLVVRRGSRIVIGLGEGYGESTGLNLCIQEGEIAILQAPNGWGKSTLFAALSGLIEIAQGEIILQGHSIQRLPAWDRVSKGLRTLPSDQHMFPSLTAREMLKLAGSGEMIAELGSLADRVCSSLSGGERQRVALASVSRGQIQLLDEPLSGLDEAAAIRAISLIEAWSCSSLLIATPSTSE